MLPFLEILETEDEKNRLIILYECFKEPLYYLAVSMVKDVNKAEDMVHDTFISIAHNLDQIDEEAYILMKQYQNEKKRRRNLSLQKYSKETRNRAFSKVWSYVSTILKNKIIDVYRKDKRQNVIFVESYFDSIVKTEETNPDQILTEEELVARLNSMILQLGYPYQEAIILRYYNKMTMVEIGRHINRTPGGVRQILMRARNILKNQLIKEGYYE